MLPHSAFTLFSEVVFYPQLSKPGWNTLLSTLTRLRIRMFPVVALILSVGMLHRGTSLRR
jgi:hypothetical protein